MSKSFHFLPLFMQKSLVQTCIIYYLVTTYTHPELSIILISDLDIVMAR